MSGGVNFNVEEVEEYAKKWERVLADEEKIMKTLIKDLALQVLIDVVRNTPVDTGRLRQGWIATSEEEAKANNSMPTRAEMERIIRVKVTGDTYTVLIENAVPYAVFVEFGHKIKARSESVGYKRGVYMLRNAEELVMRNQSTIVQQSLRKILKGYGL